MCCNVREQELDSTILMGSFQFSTFHGSVVNGRQKENRKQNQNTQKATTNQPNKTPLKKTFSVDVFQNNMDTFTHTNSQSYITGSIKWIYILINGRMAHISRFFSSYILLKYKYALIVKHFNSENVWSNRATNQSSNLKCILPAVFQY